MTTMQVINDDDAIAFAQATRKSIADTLLADGIPKTEEDRALLMKSIDGLSSTAINNKRNKNEEQLVANDGVAKQMLLRMLGMLGNKNPLETLGAPERTITIDLSDVDAGPIVEGELSIGPSMVDYASFAKKYGLE